MPLCSFGASATSGPYMIGEFIAFSDSQRFITKRHVKKVATARSNMRFNENSDLEKNFLPMMRPK
jgi:hypothetical protein